MSFPIKGLPASHPSGASRLQIGVLLLWLLTALVLGLTFSWYLTADWVVDLGAFLAWCGLR